jgi:hypothetical protein
LLLLDNAAALELLSDILDVATIVAIALGLTLTWLGVRVLLSLRKSQGPKTWGTIVRRSLGALVLLAPAVYCLGLWLSPLFEANGPGPMYTGNYLLKHEDSDLALSRHTIRLYLLLDSTYRFESTLAPPDSLSEGRWQVRVGPVGNDQQRALLLIPYGADQALYTLHPSPKRSFPYLTGYTHNSENPATSFCFFRLVLFGEATSVIR